MIGVLGSGNSSLFDSKIVLYIDCLGEQVKKHLCSVGQSGCTITLESDKTDVEEVYNTYIKNNYNVTKSTNIETGDEYLDSAIPIRYEKEYCIIIYIFCFVCISIVLRFWLSQRVHEMKICRAFGYSDRKVVIRLLSSFVSIIMVSLFFFLVLVFLLNLGFKDMIIEYNLFVSWEVVLIYISIFLLSLIVIGVKPIYCFIHNSIVEGM